MTGATALYFGRSSSCTLKREHKMFADHFVRMDSCTKWHPGTHQHAKSKATIFATTGGPRSD